MDVERWSDKAGGGGGGGDEGGVEDGGEVREERVKRGGGEAGGEEAGEEGRGEGEERAQHVGGGRGVLPVDGEGALSEHGDPGGVLAVTESVCHLQAWVRHACGLQRTFTVRHNTYLVGASVVMLTFSVAEMTVQSSMVLFVDGALPCGVGASRPSPFDPSGEPVHARRGKLLGICNMGSQQQD